MAWEKYMLCFRLLSPLHIGYRKVGNLMQTRGYVPGKNLWAALTARLTMDSNNDADGRRYVAIGQAINEYFRFGYLYPALPKDATQDVKTNDDPTIHYPWEDLFDYRFFSSYASTALNHDQQVAAEGLLHEAEFIRPWARPQDTDDRPHPVYLVGSLYVQDNLSQELAGWRTALGRVQLGGERGYGWGRLRVAPLPDRGICEKPMVKVEKNERVLAHVQIEGASIVGSVEPLVGWERNNEENSEKNWRLSAATICYSPGARVTEESTFVIGHYGIWEAAAS
ncbi:MAG: hypothetical protein M1358_15950 [Chloroflexi bacterium]|nr:hypothetical protein [Chloroflexota bacterium]